MLTYQKPRRTFEKSGAVNPEDSYYVNFENVVNSDNQDIRTMVDRGRYFSIFSPRQSGKTTFLEGICDKLNGNPAYIAITLSFQEYKSIAPALFYELIEKSFYSELIQRLKAVGCEKIDAVNRFLAKHHLTNHISFRMLFEELNRIIEFKKIVIFIDEFDGIPLEELENFLTTLRELYLKYKKIKQKALYSVGLVGIRNITKLIVGGVSPFNIADQVNLPPFSLRNVHDLYSQYTAETNQPFKEDAVKRVYEETAGQPWLVNRLGTLLTVDIKPGTVIPITETDVEKAVSLLLKERNSHFDNLYEKAKLYKESFVEIIFDNVEYNPDDEDQTWLEQYGLIKKRTAPAPGSGVPNGGNTDTEGHAAVANNIYKARYIKTFFKEVKAYEDISPQEYALPGGRLDMERILLNFEKYIARIGVNAFYEKKKPYEKTGQFLLTAFLYQFARGGAGDLGYEVKTGLGRMDIILTYRGKKYIIETKVNRHDDVTGIINEGIKQLCSKYLATEKTGAGYLVIFDTKTHVGAVCEPRYHREGDKKVTSFLIGIGRID